MSENLWPTFEASKVISPKTLMVEQANFLSESTSKGILGEVITSPSKENILTHIFRIVAPALNNYKYDLFYIQHGIIFYPLTSS